jgi:hypothetical protein
MGMNKKKAIKLAIEALRHQLKEVVFDANIFDAGIADTPHAKGCSIRRKSYFEAIEILEGLLDE